MERPELNISGHRGLRRTGAIVVLAAVALVASGCGGGEARRAVASVAASRGAPSSAAASATGNPVAYAQCMRENGVPNFPDPDKGGVLKLPPGVDANSPEFKKAHQKCNQYMGGGGTPNLGVNDLWPLDKKLKYAKCMRDHGVPSFPDPGADGTFPPFGNGGAVDPESTQFKQADRACAEYKPAGAAPQGGIGGPGAGPGGGGS